MKIGIIPPSTRTGENTYSENLITGLKRLKLDLELINPFIFNNPTNKVFIGSIFLGMYLKNKQIDILHNIDNLGPFLLSSNKMKRILTVHDIAPVLFPELYSLKMRLDFNLILSKLMSNVDLIITPSSATKIDLVDKFNIDDLKIEVVYHGVDRNFFHYQIDAEVLKKYNIKGNYLLYIGSESIRKNLKTLILSYCEIYDKIDHFLVLVGPIKKETIFKIVKKIKTNKPKQEILKKILIIGYVDKKDLPVIYSSASAFVFPSLYEGFGLPPLEAMACGTPLIISNNSAMKEVVGEAGLYLNDPLDSQELSRKIIKILEDDSLSQQLIRTGIGRSKIFKWNTTAEKTLKVYNRIYHES